MIGQLTSEEQSLYTVKREYFVSVNLKFDSLLCPFYIQMVTDEEQEVNATNSPFKVDINKIFQASLNSIGISTEEIQSNGHRDILKWLKYLTHYFMPTLPILSNLLLGIGTSLSTIAYITQQVSHFRRSYPPSPSYCSVF